jgi:hypothetical protein
MKTLIAWIRKVFPSAEAYEQRLEIDYLNQAVDIYDLEERMRELDRRRANQNDRRLVGMRSYR